jgi:hypothetical protein
MKAIHKVIHAGFAACALASASLPALSWTAWPDVELEWDADARTANASTNAPTLIASASDSIRR